MTKSSLQAGAALIRMEAEVKLLEASTLQGDVEAAKTHRQRAHDYLDAHMDAKVATQAIIRRLVDGHG